MLLEGGEDASVVRLARCIIFNININIEPAHYPHSLKSGRSCSNGLNLRARSVCRTEPC